MKVPQQNKETPNPEFESILNFPLKYLSCSLQEEVSMSGISKIKNLDHLSISYREPKFSLFKHIGEIKNLKSLRFISRSKKIKNLKCLEELENLIHFSRPNICPINILFISKISQN